MVAGSDLGAAVAEASAIIEKTMPVRLVGKTRSGVRPQTSINASAGDASMT